MPTIGGFRVNSNVLNKLRQRKRRILRRIENRPGPESESPLITAGNIQYELADRVGGLACGGIGAMLLLARRTGLIATIDQKLQLLKRHLPYHESDHVLNIAFNILAGGHKLEHLEWRRNDEVYLNALGAQRIPDPTTAGDFCRRFGRGDVLDLMDAINQTRLRVWNQQPKEFFQEAIIDADGSVIATDAACKEGVDLAYNGVWGGWIPEKCYAAIASGCSEGSGCAIGGLITASAFNSASMSGAAHCQSRRRSRAIAACVRSIVSSHRPVKTAARSTSIASAFSSFQ